MDLIQRNSVIFSSMILLFSLSSQLFASESSCSFNSMVTADEYSYRISSNQVDTCKKQILSISVLKNAYPFTQFVNPVDVIAENAWAEDIDDDGRFELLVVSRSVDMPDVKTLDIYSVDGNALKQVRLPELADKSDYRGRDSFFREGERIVRSYPAYLPKDADGKPSGGEKKILYQYRNRQLLLAASVSQSKPQSAPVSSDSSKRVGPVKVLAIQAKQDYIEIKTSVSTDKYKVFRISDPWRLVMDFPGAVTDMHDKSVVIDRFGISRARVGLNKGFVRIVFDSAGPTLPTETVTPAENAVRIGFYNSK